MLTLTRNDCIFKTSKIMSCKSLRRGDYETEPKIEALCPKIDSVACTAEPNKDTRPFCFVSLILTVGVVPVGEQVLKAKRCQFRGALSSAGRLAAPHESTQGRCMKASMNRNVLAWLNPCSPFVNFNGGSGGVLEPATNSGRNMDLNYSGLGLD
jgi:hypothetical protein